VRHTADERRVVARLEGDLAQHLEFWVHDRARRGHTGGVRPDSTPRSACAHGRRDRHCDVPLLAQIVGIVDAFDDALTSLRPYRTALSQQEAGQYPLEQAGQGKFARRFVEAFLDTLGEEEAGHVH
jgi:hypothetical protein